MALLAVLLSGLGTGCAPSLAVPPRLIMATPMPGAVVADLPRALELDFNRPLAAPASWARFSTASEDLDLADHSQLDPSDPTRLTLRLPDTVKPGVYRVHWHAVAQTTGATHEGTYTLTVQPGVGRAPRLSVSPPTAEAGDVLEVVGRGFTPDSVLRLTIGDNEDLLKQVQTDGHGELNVEVRVPPSAMFGVQPLVATDASGARASSPLHVRWGGWPPLVAWTIGEPGPVPGQVTFAVSLRNLSDYVLEGVQVSLETPAGATFAAAWPPTAPVDGTLTWDLGVLDRGTAGPFRASFVASGQTVAHTRVAFRHRRPFDCSGDACLTAFVSETTSESTPISP